MAVPAKKMVGVSDDSSSSDDEALRRCQEAVWETKTIKTKGLDSGTKLRYMQPPAVPNRDPKT